MGRHTAKAGEASHAEARPPLPYPVRDGRVPPTVQAAQERRRQRRRSRLAALSAASMLAIGGAAGMSMALADSGASTEGEIVFNGSCGLLGLVAPSSKPNTAELTVVEGSQVTYTNKLGVKAELHVGLDRYTVGSGASQVFVMNRSAEVAMVPNCTGLFAEYGSAQVLVVAPEPKPDSPPPPPDSAESPSPGGSSGGSSGGSTGSSGGSSGGSTGGSTGGSSGGGSTESGDAGQTPSGSSGGRDAGPSAGADDAEGRRAPDEGIEDADDTATESEDEDELPSFGLLDDRDDAASDEFAPAAEEVAAVDPRAVADGASGLLALVAIVCLVGVSAAVARTLLKQRTAV
jgi:hypothetical protein